MSVGWTFDDLGGVFVNIEDLDGFFVVFAVLTGFVRGFGHLGGAVMSFDDCVEVRQSFGDLDEAVISSFTAQNGSTDTAQLHTREKTAKSGAISHRNPKSQRSDLRLWSGENQ